ncbi:hypothetical protein G6F57_021513 [Rhizopus arrhizus]|nr:hypothetical protein G6F57_021513 [Rhizopus arrhizus]
MSISDRWPLRCSINDVETLLNTRVAVECVSSTAHRPIAGSLADTQVRNKAPYCFDGSRWSCAISVCRGHTWISAGIADRSQGITTSWEITPDGGSICGGR